MPAKLKDPTEPVKWRIRSEDLSYLRAMYGNGRVNAVARNVLHAYVELERKRRADRVELN